MSTKSVLAWLAGLLVLGALVAPGASAGKPTIERFDIDQTFSDDFLSAACGIPVTTRVAGHVIVRTFPNGTGPAQLRTLNLGFAAMAGGNTFRFRDVGADLVRIEPDGTAILMIIGQVPFDFTGVLKIDLETGEAILEPQHTTGDRVDRACAVLTG
jgi:hypothetical protein